jgi:hypothetical protein
MEETLKATGYGRILELTGSARPLVLKSPDSGAPSRLDAAIGRARRTVERASGRDRR